MKSSTQIQKPKSGADIYYNAEYIGLNTHERRTGVPSLNEYPNRLILILLHVTLFILLPLCMMMVASWIYFSNHGKGYILLIIISLLIIFYMTKMLIYKMNVYSAYLRGFLFILIPGLIVSFFFYVDKDRIIIDPLSHHLDRLAATLFNVSHEMEPAGYGELIQYLFGGLFSFILLIGLYGHFTRCRKCHAWLDPYKDVYNSGTVATSTKTTKNYVVTEIDRYNDIANEISSSTEYYSTELVVYKCHKCESIDMRKLEKKI